jgi:hypothetical protein
VCNRSTRAPLDLRLLTGSRNSSGTTDPERPLDGGRLVALKQTVAYVWHELRPQANLPEDFRSIDRLGDIGASPKCYAVACSTGTGRNNSGLKNRLAITAKMIGVKPITAAKTSRPVPPNTPFLKSP